MLITRFKIRTVKLVRLDKGHQHYPGILNVFFLRLIACRHLYCMYGVLLFLLFHETCNHNKILNISMLFFSQVHYNNSLFETFLKLNAFNSVH